MTAGLFLGYYVLIYHNGTYSTRYAHLSSVAVSTGQYVTAGTVIGYEGDTGNVTGPHLHFEVYENGTRVNPAQFLLISPVFSHLYIAKRAYHRMIPSCGKLLF